MMPRFSPLSAISLGLVFMTISLVLMGDVLVGLMPGHTRQVFQYRRTVSEALAVQYSLLASHDDFNTIKGAMRELVSRNHDLPSMALLDNNGKPLATIGEHRKHWIQPADDQSTIDHIQVPIYNGDTPWGTLQLAFAPVEAAGLDWLMTNSWVHFVLFMGVMGYVGYMLFMKHTLRHLDPSVVIPPRVKATLDVLDEGVVMLDKSGAVVLANDSFSRRVGRDHESLLGHSLESLPWVNTIQNELPWIKVLKSKAPRAKNKLILTLPSGEPKSFVVNAAGVLDELGKTRGCMVSFSDVTELEQANGQLRHAISDLESSKTQVMRKNQELAVTNETLQVEISERKKVQAEREELHKKLIESSRRAGMADVASTVLHNIGNVLNSVNVSVEVVSKTLRQAPINDVALIATMLREHSHDLATFLTEDARGKQVPSYLTMLAEAVKNNSTLVDQELVALGKNIEHIRHVITQQEDLARPGEVMLTPVLFSELFQQALAINRPALEKAGVAIVQEYAPLPQALTDQHQVLQILVNLVSNATNAMAEAEGRQHRLVLRLAPAGDRPGFVRFQVIDSGVGSKPENLPRLFTQGFTTRKDGHGIGLHSASLAAKNLGGALSARSEGEGRGATFTLDLPFKVLEMAA